VPALVDELLRDAAAKHPEREAYVHGVDRLTYSELDRAADGFAAVLLERQVARGDRVCLLLPSSIDFAVCYLGALRVGAITSAVNLRLGAAEVASIVERTEPSVTVVDNGRRPPVGPDPGVVIGRVELHDAFREPAPPDAALPRRAPDDATCLVWTSGTTGAPKGAVYDHTTQEAISRNIGELTVDAERRLVVLPFPHVGYMTRMWDELAYVTTLVLAGEPWSATETLRLIRDEGITMATGVPTQWSLVLGHADLARTDFSGLRVAGIGGAAIAPELVRSMRAVLGCPVLSRYTSTEAGVTTSTRIGDPDQAVAETVGRPAPDVELRIVDPERADRPDVEPGSVGEVICRSPAMMRGYWRDPERTAEVVDAAGYLHTGDLGFVGADGNLRLVGRLKEMYIRGGYNVYPAEVESVLVEHPLVARVAVVGAPDPVLGEIGAAFVVPAHSGHPLALETLRDLCRSRLADYKAPDRLVIVDELPLTSMLKVDTRELLRRLG
jgi:acyl-CoA synthetase (AMP-forming)/AMP-acid ligase II